jgi:hypothetical protein
MAILTKEQIEAYVAWVEKRFIPQLNKLPLPTTEDVIASHEALRQLNDSLATRIHYVAGDAAKAEREECAKAAEETAEHVSKSCCDHISKHIANKIRERK